MGFARSDKAFMATARRFALELLSAPPPDPTELVNDFRDVRSGTISLADEIDLANARREARRLNWSRGRLVRRRG